MKLRKIQITMQKTSGSSLLLVCIGLGVASTVGYYATQSITNQFRTFSHYALMGEAEDLKRYYISAIDCTKTFPTVPAVCSTLAGGYIGVKLKDILIPTGKSDVLIEPAARGTRFKKSFFKVRAWCGLDKSGSGKSMRIDFNRIDFDPATNIDRKLLTDPATGLYFNGEAPRQAGFVDPTSTGWKSVFQGLNLCSSYL